jgi:hypothetical protein
MCRSIVTLHRAQEPATEDEVHAAALQFVRKISGYRAPSRANEAAFDEAVDEVAEATQRLLETLAPRGTRQPSGTTSTRLEGRTA